MRVFFFIAFFVLATVAAVPVESGRIVGGLQTIIEQYPFSASLLRLGAGNAFRIQCGGSIINNRAILTAAHCFDQTAVDVWRTRVGSTNAHTGGTLLLINRLIVHPNYRRATLDSDIAILRTTSVITFGNTVRPGTIAGANYNVPDNLVVWAIGWGSTVHMGNTVEQLRHVQVRTVNQAVCRNRYAELSLAVTDNMLCTGMLDIGGRGQCQGDSGSPVLHNNVIVAVTSWGWMCAQPRHPAVNVRVTRFAPWIVANA